MTFDTQNIHKMVKKTQSDSLTTKCRNDLITRLKIDKYTHSHKHINRTNFQTRNT